jgi:uncharacterized protein
MKKQLNWLLSIVCILFSSVTLGNKLPEYGGTLVNDFSNLIPEQQEISLLNVLKDYENKTSVQICVVTVDSIGEEYDMNSFTTALFNKWGVGQSGADNGILIVISLSPRGWFIQPGYGLEGYLTDISSKRIGEKNFPHNFRSGNFYAGILSAVEDMKNVIGSEAWAIREKLKREKEAQEQAAMDEFLSYLIVFVVLLLFGIIAFVVYSKKKKAKLRFAQIVEERKKHKEKLERERLENIESARRKKNNISSHIKQTSNMVESFKTINPNDYERYLPEVNLIESESKQLDNINPNTNPNDIHHIFDALLIRLSEITKDITEKQTLTSNILEAYNNLREVTQFKQIASNNSVGILKRIQEKYPLMPMVDPNEFMVENNTLISNYIGLINSAKAQVEGWNYDLAKSDYNLSLSNLDSLTKRFSDASSFEAKVKTAESYLLTAQRTLAIPETNCKNLLSDSDVSSYTKGKLRHSISVLSNFNVNEYSNNPIEGQRCIEKIVKDAEKVISDAKQEIYKAEEERKEEERRKAAAIAAELAAARERERERERQRERERESQRSYSNMGGGRSGGAGAGGSW